MKRWIVLLLALCVCVTPLLPVGAAGRVTYDGRARECVFAPGSEYSLTDLFTDFKDVMPGDSLSQTVTVYNDASDEVKVKIYMRALGAHKGSEDFLSQLHLRVGKSARNEMGYMFDAAADETAGLTDWVCLGMLYSGGRVDLDVSLDVPVTLNNAYSEQIGYLDWEFRIEEFPVEPGDPQAPDTGDAGRVWPWVCSLLISAALLLLLWRRGKDRRPTQA